MPRSYRLTPLDLQMLAALPKRRNRLRDACRLAGCLQMDVVRATGIPSSNLSRIVNHKRYQTVTIGTAHRLAAFFGAPVDVLFPSPK